MTRTISPRAAAAIAECKRIVGAFGEADPFGAEWRSMSEGEREFWLKVSRQPVRYARTDKWSEVPCEVRATLKNNLFRAAMRARTLLGGVPA